MMRLAALGLSEVKDPMNSSERWKIFLDVSRVADEANSEFKVDDFIPSAHKCYKEFVALVAEVCAQNDENHQAKTMFNILTNSTKEKKERIETACSHFNARKTLFKRELDRLHTLAQELNSMRLGGNRNQGNESTENFSDYLKRRGFTLGLMKDGLG